MANKILILLSVFLGVILISIVGNIQSKAESKAPFSVSQCDLWLSTAKGSGSFQEGAYWASLATACYQSNSVQR